MKGVPAPPAERRLTPPFTEEHEELRASLRRFVEAELLPHADEWEEDRWFPDALFPRMGELGFLGLKYEERYGGQGGGYMHDAVLAEELARCGSGGVAAGLGAHITIATPPVWKFGTEDQKQRYLVPSIAGTKIAGLAITEPDAGSDVAGMKTLARPAEGGWMLNGSKMFITNGVRANYLVLAAKTKPEGGHGGISFFLVDTDQPGYVASKIEKLGWHASDTALIALDDVFVPAENLLGELHGGFKLIMANFQWERLSMALGAVAAAQHCFELTLRYAAERQAFGRPISGFQVTRHKFAEMATTIEAGRDADLLRAAPVRRRPRRAAGGDEGQAVHAAGGVRRRRQLPADPRRRRLHGRVRDRARRTRRAPGPDRRRHRRDHEGDPRPHDGAVGLRQRGRPRRNRFRRGPLPTSPLGGLSRRASSNRSVWSLVPSTASEPGPLPQTGTTAPVCCWLGGAATGAAPGPP